MNTKKILRYANWTGRDLFHYCLVRELVKHQQAEALPPKNNDSTT